MVSCTGMQLYPLPVYLFGDYLELNKTKLRKQTNSLNELGRPRASEEAIEIDASGHDR